MKRVWDHMRGLWPRWTLLPGLPFLLYPLYLLVIRREPRPELVAFGLLGSILPYIGPRAKKLYLGIVPIGIVGLFYDSMRFVRNLGVTPERLHICDLRALDMKIWSVTVNGQEGSVHDWIVLHTNPFLDAYFSIPYGSFIGAAFIFSFYMYFKDYALMRRFTTAFLILNIMAFITYHLYPAAPPWYYHLHGCAVDLAVKPSEGAALARVDEMLGYRYFGNFYGRSSDVFGAVPSLHVAYPALIAIDGYKHFNWPLRVITIIYAFSMAGAAVYLDHHWIIDVIVGITYTIIVLFGVRWAYARFAAPSEVGAK